MSGIPWELVRAELREAAERACTPRQLEAVALRAAGLGPADAAQHMGTTKQAASALFERAAERIRAEMLTNNTYMEGHVLGATNGR